MSLGDDECDVLRWVMEDDDDECVSESLVVKVGALSVDEAKCVW